MWTKARPVPFVMFFFSCLLGALPPVLSQAQQPTTEKNAQSQSIPAASSSEASKYVGSETCKTCHEDLYNGWEKTPHWKTTLDTRGGPSHQGCEGCHGPGADHVAGGGDKTKIFIFEHASAKEIDARCLTCHAGAHPNFERSPHGRDTVTCTDCNGAHTFKSEANLLKV